MAQKITPSRDYLKGLNDEGKAPEKRKYTNEEKMKRYFANFNKTHYRTIGIKFNIDKEEEILAWLDYQPTLKPYLKRLIVEDMKRPENKETFQDAIDFYEECKKGNITTGDIPNYPKKKLSDVLMKCENCNSDTTITARTFVKLTKHGQQFICPKCGAFMKPVNQPELSAEEIEYYEEQMDEE